MGAVRPLLVISLMLGLNVLSTIMICHPGNPNPLDNNTLNSDHPVPPSPKFIITKKNATTGVAHAIVEKAFRETYAHLVELCGTLEGNLALPQCLNRLYQTRNDRPHPLDDNPLGTTTPTTTTKTTWPWWFQTLLRDAKNLQSGLYGPWHFLQFPDPLMQLCVYEKGATKMWRHVHCQVLERTHHTKFPDITHCYKQQGPLVTTSNNNNNTAVQRSVFLRDPLERFLSGFLDKCTGTNRLVQGHCQPTSIFQSNQTDHVTDFIKETKTLFEIYVDTLPLKWDLHFMPLSLHCGGLYQKIGQYNFVGLMNEKFYQDLGRFQEVYPNLKQEVDNVFTVKSRQGSINQGTERQAAKHAKTFYTPNTIRRVLQYTSIDYMLLNLKIPQWAEEMLQE